jgi:glucokinase
VAALAIAGPVEEGTRSAPPNIAWDLDLDRDAPALGLGRWVLLNDFAAQAYACRTPVLAGAEEVLSGRPDPRGVLAVVGAGTGLGKAALVPDGRGGWLVLASEAGHGLFPFASEAELEFWRFARQATGRSQVIGDLVCTGSGLSLLHRFLTGEDKTPAEAAAAFGPGSATLEWFARFLGRACREFALQTVALGGVVVAGASPPAIRPWCATRPSPPSSGSPRPTPRCSRAFRCGSSRTRTPDCGARPWPACPGSGRDLRGDPGEPREDTVLLTFFFTFQY